MEYEANLSGIGTGLGSFLQKSFIVWQLQVVCHVVAVIWFTESTFLFSWGSENYRYFYLRYKLTAVSSCAGFILCIHRSPRKLLPDAIQQNSFCNESSTFLLLPFQQVSWSRENFYHLASAGLRQCRIWEYACHKSIYYWYFTGKIFGTFMF